MIFHFRGKTVELDKKCLELSDGKLKATGERFDFHNSTVDHFIKENGGKSGGDLCHRYSFSAMTELLCILYNSKKLDEIPNLIYALYPYDEEQNFMLKIYNDIKLQESYDPEDVFNTLLYYFNNAISNLRYGNKNWNRSIGESYDPVSWIYNNKEQAFYITDEVDIYMLHILNSINITPSTLYFYTAIAPDGTPVMYSSNNPSKYEGIENYEKFKKPIYINSKDILQNPVKIQLA